MLVKLLKKLFSPSVHSIEQESPHDTTKVIDEANKVAKEAKISIQRLSDATEEVRYEIEKNGFAHYFKYDKPHKDEEEMIHDVYQGGEERK